MGSRSSSAFHHLLLSRNASEVPSPSLPRRHAPSFLSPSPERSSSILVSTPTLVSFRLPSRRSKSVSLQQSPVSRKRNSAGGSAATVAADDDTGLVAAETAGYATTLLTATSRSERTPRL